MKKIEIVVTLAILSTLSLDATDMHLEEQMYAPARQMEMLNDSMNRGIEAQRKKNRENPIVFEDNQAFQDAPMVEFIDKGNQYLLEEPIEDANNTKVTVSISGNELSITMKTTRKDTMKSGNSSSSSSYTSTTSTTITIPADADARQMQHDYENGVLKVTIPKIEKFKH